VNRRYVAETALAGSVGEMRCVRDCRLASPCENITQRSLIVCYRRFGATCRSHLQASGSPRRLDCLILEEGNNRLSETSGTNYQCTLSKIAEQRKSDIWDSSITEVVTVVLHGETVGE
jgi:hypothetical protein